MDMKKLVLKVSVECEGEELASGTLDMNAIIFVYKWERAFKVTHTLSGLWDKVVGEAIKKWDEENLAEKFWVWNK